MKIASAFEMMIAIVFARLDKSSTSGAMRTRYKTRSRIFS